MSIITIDTAALGTIVQELASEELAGLGTLFLNGRADGIASLQRRLLSLARKPAPAQSLANHVDVIGPVAWHHQLRAGEVFVDGESSRPFESLKQALNQLDQFGGTVEPLFKLREFAGGVPRAPAAETNTTVPDAHSMLRSQPALKLVTASEITSGQPGSKPEES